MVTKITDLDDYSFWSWLAGLSDGEACFALRVSGRFPSYRPEYVMGLRADDYPMLSAIQKRAHIGYLRSLPRGGKNPQVSWSVTNISECRRLADGFRSGAGLFSKKARDFALWCRAVDLIAEYGGGVARSPVADELAALKAQLHMVKEFDANRAAGWDQFLGRRSFPVVGADEFPRTRPTRRGDGSYNSRAAKRFWSSERGAEEKLARQQRYSRLSQEQIDEIIRRVLAGERRKDLAQEFGVSHQFIGTLVRGGRPRRDGTLQPMDGITGPKASSPEFWKSEAGQKAQRERAKLRGKISQEQIDRLVERNKNGESAYSLAKEYGISKPLALKFIKGNYIRRD